MKKIMFNDKYGLTQAVLEGRKTITRRGVGVEYKVGEVVAIAQSYETLANSGYLDKMMDGSLSMKKEYAGAGYKNKMFVKADLMPHHIKITNIRVEHLQDISDDDCMKEGIYKHDPVHIVGYNHNFIAYSYDATEDPYLKKWWFRTPREAFQKLIDKVSGKGTWDSNPIVRVYEFELVD